MALRYNMACFKTSQCIMSTFFILPDGDEQSNDGFSCWSTHACLYGHQLVDEGAKITVMDACVGYRTMVCTRQGMVYTDAPARRTACTAPFTPYSFGCMYLPEDYTGMHCEARQFCESLGSQFASPATHEDVKAMTAYFTQLYEGSRMIHLGLRLLGGTWRWPSNLRDPGSFGTGDWHKTQPDPSAIACNNEPQQQWRVTTNHNSNDVQQTTAAMTCKNKHSSNDVQQQTQQQ
ncbi:C-type lectin fold [Trinorchestia longiramus]|nr:C-type lectin fold [Trinorchestia longiramus]